MKTAAIYARFSTDLQNDRSIDDQLALCRSYAERNGCRVVATYTDRALSGSSLRNRPGIIDLLTAARDHAFETVIAESTSRLGRDQEDRAAIRKRLRFANIVIMTPADGIVTDLTDGIRAVIDSQYIDDLRHATRRALRGRINEGLSAGGRAYGYAAVPGEKGKRVIVESEAVIVRRIFAEFLADISPRAIAKRLNDDGIPSPRGGKWNASTINGNGRRGCGILRNGLYAGELVWNKVRMVKDPETSRRVSQSNPPNEWQTVSIPQLAIVDRESFVAAQARKAALRETPPSRQRRAKHILSGLLRCSCGAGMSVKGRDKSGRLRVRCSAYSESGSCPSPATFYLDIIEQTVLQALRKELQHPDVIKEFVRTYHAERKRLAGEGAAKQLQTERRLGELGREIDRLVDAIAKGHGDPAVLGPRSTALAAERQALEASLTASRPAKVIDLHPAALARYDYMIARLQASLAHCVDAGDADAAEALRDLVESATVYRAAHRPHGLEIVIAGRLNALLGDGVFPDGLRAVGGTAVAGTRYRLNPHPEPLRFRILAA